MEEIYAILKEVRPESVLEEKYHIQIDGLDIVPDNFCTTEAIIRLLKKNGANL